MYETEKKKIHKQITKVWQENDKAFEVAVDNIVVIDVANNIVVTGDDNDKNVVIAGDNVDEKKWVGDIVWGNLRGCNLIGMFQTHLSLGLSMKKYHKPFTMLPADSRFKRCLWHQTCKVWRINFINNIINQIIDCFCFKTRLDVLSLILWAWT